MYFVSPTFVRMKMEQMEKMLPLRIKPIKILIYKIFIHKVTAF